MIVQSSKEDLEKHQPYSIKALTFHHQACAMKLIEQTFLGEPLRSGFYRQFPDRRSDEHEYWRIIELIYGEQFFANGWSFGVFDQANGQLFGVLLAADFRHKIPSDSFEHMKYALAPSIFRIEQQLVKSVVPKYRKIISQNEEKIIYLQFAGISENHKGKRLLSRMITAYEQEARKQRFSYSICWASNVITGAVLQKMGYEVISEMNVKELQQNGVHVLSQIDEEQKINRLWLKRLASIEKETNLINL